MSLIIIIIFNLVEYLKNDFFESVFSFHGSWFGFKTGHNCMLFISFTWFVIDDIWLDFDLFYGYLCEKLRKVWSN